MDALALARWQFAITTVYHFLFVPVTIGMSALVAYYHVRWVRHRDPADLRLTKFLGKLFTINFALGLVTGIVQEFQFGMNWSDYSRFVGDIFGAPLAIEALLAFFLESVFLGLWIFGWGRLPEKLHAATMWVVHIGTVLSAYFILSANSFMQHPVGYRFNEATGRAELTDFGAVLTNPVQLVTFPHTITASYMAGGAVVLGVGIYRMRRRDVGNDASMYRRMTRAGAIVTLVAGLAVAFTGDLQGKIMTEVQPMKMAAAEALYESADSCAPFSLFTIGSLDGTQERFSITVPCLLSFLATGSFSGPGRGDQRPAGAVPPAVRPVREPAGDGRDVPAEHSPRLLELPAHDRGRDAVRPRGIGCPVGDPTRESPHAVRGSVGPALDLGRRAHPADAGVRCGVRLDLHRDRPTTLAGLRDDDHRHRRLAVRLGR